MFFLFADDMKICRTVSSATDCTLLQSEIDYIRDWFPANCMKLYTEKARVIDIIIRFVISVVLNKLIRVDSIGKPTRAHF